MAKPPEPETPPDPIDRLSLASICLLASFTADNHANLGDDLTRLLLHLSHDPKPGAHKSKP